MAPAAADIRAAAAMLSMILAGLKARNGLSVIADFTHSEQARNRSRARRDGIIDASQRRLFQA